MSDLSLIKLILISLNFPFIQDDVSYFHSFNDVHIDSLKVTSFFKFSNDSNLVGYILNVSSYSLYFLDNFSKSLNWPSYYANSVIASSIFISYVKYLGFCTIEVNSFAFFSNSGIKLFNI